MSELRALEMLNSQLLATIERQRRIICELLIKNQALRKRLTHIETSADEPSGRESMKRRIEPAPRTARFAEVRIHRGNETQVLRGAPS